MDKNKLKFSYVVSALSPYVDQLNTDFLEKVVGKVRTLDYVTIVPDVKYQKQVNLPNSTITFTSADSCGFDPSGSTTYDKVVIGVCDVKYEDQLCNNTLENYWIGKFMKKGSVQDEIPFEQYWMNEKMNKIAVELDKIFWQGDVTGQTGNLALCDGIIEKLKYASPSRVSVPSASGLTSSSTVIADLQTLVSNIPDAIIDEDLTLFVDPAIFTALQSALFAGKYFNPQTFNVDGGTYVLPFKPNVTVVSTAGLAGTDKAILGKSEYIMWGTDLAPSDEPLKSEYNFRLDAVLVRYRVKIGAQIAYSDLFVTNF